jgi:hypothetical protein
MVRSTERKFWIPGMFNLSSKTRLPAQIFIDLVSTIKCRFFDAGFYCGVSISLAVRFEKARMFSHLATG